jgi:DNA-binding NtrC family response regulator
MSKTCNLVLVVDDDLGMLKCVQRLLREHAYEPTLFSSARAFKSHTDFENAACVILDINLLDGSGIELRQGLKADGVSVPVIYITGNDNPTVREDERPRVIPRRSLPTMPWQDDGRRRVSAPWRSDRLTAANPCRA